MSQKVKISIIISTIIICVSVGLMLGLLLFTEKPASGYYEIGYLTYDYYTNSETGENIGIVNYCDTAATGSISISSSFSVDGITYTVREISSSAFSRCTGVTKVTIPSSIRTIGSSAFYGCSGMTSISISSGVTLINNSAFGECTSLSSISLPSSVTEMYDSVFYCCTSLTSISIPNSVTIFSSSMFSGCTKLSSASIGNGVTVLPGGTFTDCTSLTSITLGSGIKEIDYTNAFNNCSKLSSFSVNSSNKYFAASDGVLYNKSLTKICMYPMGKTTTSFTIPSTVFEIRGDAFNYCVYLTTVTCGSAMTKIDDYAFRYCTSLKTVNFTEKIRAIGQYAFYGCSNITSTTLPNSLITIYSYAFYGCGITSVTIPECLVDLLSCALGNCNITSIQVDSNNKYFRVEDGVLYDDAKTIIHRCVTNKVTDEFVVPSTVRTINGYAFYNCAGIKNIVISESVVKLNTYAFRGCSGLTNITIPASVVLMESNVFYGCSGLVNVVFLREIISIPDYTFQNCTNLTNFEIPNSVRYIGRSAFSGCVNLKNINIPNGVTSLNGGVFYNCSSLESLLLPDSLITISSSALYGCKSLKSLTIPENVNVIESSAFYGCSGLEEIYYNATLVNDLSSNNTFYEAGCDGNGIELHIGANVKNIPNMLFYGGNSAKIINIVFEEGSKCTKIGQESFRYCADLVSINLPEGLTSIGDSAFRNCSSLVNIDLPDSVVNLGQYAFYGCTALKKIELGDGITTLNQYTFRNCSGLESVVLGANITTLDKYAFHSCTMLKEIIYNSTSVTDLSSNNYVFYNAGTGGDGITVVIGANVEKIPAYLFYPYSSSTVPKIVSVIFEEGSNCTSIGNYAFYYATNLLSITIPEKVTTFGSYAFRYCSAMTNVTFLQTSNFTMSSYCFRNGLSTAVYSFANQSVLDATKSSYGTTSYFTNTDFVLMSPVTVSTSATLGCEAYGSGVYANNSRVVVHAVYDPRCTFVGWRDSSGTIVSNDVSYAFTATSDISLTAVVEGLFDVSFSANNEEFGSVTVSDCLVVAGDVLNVIAVANPGYKFMYWQDNLVNKIYENPLNQLANEAVTNYTAMFGISLENNGVCLLDSALVSGIEESTQKVNKAESNELEAMGFSSFVCFTTSEGVQSIRVTATPSTGYEFICWAVMENDGSLTVLKDTSGVNYSSTADILASLVKDKVVVACFKVQ